MIAAKDYNVMSCHINSISSCRLRESVEGKSEDDSVCLEDISSYLCRVQAAPLSSAVGLPRDAS